MEKIGRVAEKILEELSDGNIHIRNDMLNNQKRILRKNEDPNIEFKFNIALSRLMKLNYIERKNRGEYRITQNGSLIIHENRDELYDKIEKYKKISDKNAKLAYEIFCEANSIFLIKKIKSIKYNVAEQNFGSSLSKYLDKVMEERNIQGYYAEANYNRNGYRTKTIIDDNYEVINIECDLIVHSMGENKQQDNLLAIEMKKSDNPKERKKDRKRLTIVTRDTYNGEVFYEEFPRHICRYALGIFYDIDKDNNQLELEFYQHGEIKWKEKIKFNELGKIIKKEKIKV